MYISQKRYEISHVVHRLTLKAFFKQVPVTSILLIIVIHIRTCYTLNRLPHLLLTLTNQKVEMISHQAIAIIGAVRSTRKPVIIHTHAHPIKSIDKLPIILFIFKAAIKRVQCLARLSIVEREQARPKVRDILMIDATHHHMKYPCARFLPRLPRHTCILDPFIPSV